MNKIIIETVDLYESTRGVMCYIRDKSRCWFKIIEKEDEEYLPGQEVDVTNFVLQNGKVFSQKPKRYFG